MSLDLKKLYIRSLLDSSLSVSKKLALAKNAFASRDAFIFAAGPSLSHVDIASMKGALRDSLVICIKQSYNVVEEFCDILLLNFCNYQEYDWNTMECPVVWAAFEEDHQELISQKNIKCSALVRVINNKNGLDDTTASRRSWHDFFELHKGVAYWGPGLMYELAIPLAVNLGVRRIYLVGWDIGALRDNASDVSFMNDHFYDDGELQTRTKISNTEIRVVANSTLSLMHWLRSRNIELKVISDRSLVHSAVERDLRWIGN